MSTVRKYIGSLCLLLLVSSISVSTSASPRAPLDITVASLEITQAAQTPSNSITLVSERSTAVRATLATGESVPVSGIQGHLHVFVSGVQITPSGGIGGINEPFSAPPSPQRANENDTLNFELLAPTGITASTDVDFQVDIDQVAGESNTANNSGTVSNLTFVDRTTPFLYFTKVNYSPAGLGLPATSFVQAGSGDAFVRGILPVNDVDPNLYRAGPFASLPYSGDSNGDGILDALGSDGNGLLNLLESCRQYIVSHGGGASDRVFLYGWLAGNPIDGNGAATVGGRVAFGNTDPIRGQRSYAHELTHNFGLNHNTRTLDQVGWDVGGRLLNNPAGNNVTGRVKPTTFFDIQNPGKLTNQAWVDTITYNFLLSSPTLASPPASKTRESVKLARRVAVIEGFFDRSGKELVQLLPVRRLPWASQPSPPSKGRFAVRLTTSTGQLITQGFDPVIADDPSKRPEVEEFGAFSVMVAVSPSQQIQSVQIVDLLKNRTFARLEKTEPPKIQITSPDPGSVLTRGTPISWSIEDPDTPVNQLMIEVAYSWNNGKSWVPVAVQLPGGTTKILPKYGRLPKSNGKARLRVFVFDGLNTSFASVGGLSKN